MYKRKYYKFFSSPLCISFIGNFLEHYDNALYGLLIPFLSIKFFPNQDFMLNLIYGYLVLTIGILIKPIGAFFLGRIGDTQGRKKALSLSFFGTALTTLSFCFLPTYQDIGILSPCLLIFLRLLQNFFSSAVKSALK